MRWRICLSPSQKVTGGETERGRESDLEGEKEEGERKRGRERDREGERGRKGEVTESRPRGIS